MNKTTSLVSATPRQRISLRGFLSTLAAGAVCLLVGCSTKEPEPRYRSYIFYENNVASAGALTIPLKMPITPKEPFYVISEPQIADLFFTDTVACEVGPPNARFPSLLVRLNARATSKLAGDSLALMGKHIFLVVNGKPVGMHRVTNEIRNGEIFFHMQLSDDPAKLTRAIYELDKDLNESILIIRKKLEKK
ncbi:MAG: hypothetical protein LBS59_08580 [Puniceicoccales bacterium]|jgi:hypothetical protein|nr:hypothetical protein [Puniceicoccales bacterium]